MTSPLDRWMLNGFKRLKSRLFNKVIIYFELSKPHMAERYGREVTGQCQVCGYKGKTQIHHIISQHTIEKLKEGVTIKYSMKVYFKQIKELILIS